MSYEIALSEDRLVLVCRVKAPVTVELAASFAREMSRMGDEVGVQRFLADVRGWPNVSRPAQNYNYAYGQMPAMSLRRDARAAILVDPADDSHDFVETVSQNAGYNMRIFRDEAAALAWLKSG